ncbi:MAG: hypothetical protein CL388_03015 [Acidiferrobacteraceae bacterium]|nr:hypothetical protein [Acidiferrobacteraceae bacterium]
MTRAPSSTQQPSDMSQQAIEEAHIDRVLKLANWHRGEACRTLGISRPRLRCGLTDPNQLRELKSTSLILRRPIVDYN